ncbi:ALPHA-MANNOSIDASE [Salix koriyanagi]|uniref:ALPHA-MANNOSIDASE n=1 Tax=Salix koriyanagi TaxID=2511006 RepID=A0A9Q0ZG69_9ROSI|nr:ALPHA-MANNOSIDASE [Salix koriyanagi]
MRFHIVNGGYVNYNTGGGVVPGKLNVHLVPHSHDDVGWLKTVDQYYVGSNNSIQGACVENVLDSVVESLRRDSNRKFVFVEMAFFQRWWVEQSEEIQEQGGRDLTFLCKLTFLGPSLDLILYTLQGLITRTEQSAKVIKLLKLYGVDPRHLVLPLRFLPMPFLYITAPHLVFILKYFDNFVPVQDNPLLDDYNVEQRVNDFINAAMTQANVTRTNHIMWTMGDDFQYQYAESWFKQMDKFIHYVNKDGRVNALYSTPSIYTDVKNAANESWPLKTDDYFPYADGDNSYWTGFFTSRPALKRYVRQLSGYYLAARQLEFLVGKKSTGPNTYRLGDALGIAQHHDGVSGTAKQHTTNDYEKRLAIGAVEAEATVSSALSCLVSNKSTDQCEKPALNFSQCQLLNISYCPPTEEAIANGKTLVMVVYNALGWNRNDIIRIPVNDPNLVVSDSDGKHIKTQYVSMDNTTSNLRNFYLKAYGFPSIQVPRYWLHFQVSVPPLGWSTYFIASAPWDREKKKRTLCDGQPTE